MRTDKGKWRLTSQSSFWQVCYSILILVFLTTCLKNTDPFHFLFSTGILKLWNMMPNEIQVQTNNFVEVSPASARVDMNTNFQKCFKYMIGLGVLLFILILVFSMTFMKDNETETLKQCLPGHYKFPDCIRKSINQPIWIFLWS